MSKKAGVRTLDSATATAVAEALQGGQAWVLWRRLKPHQGRPAAPFTTSTLQQEASGKLHLSSRDTMRVAQSLYENGFITLYMRTDSTNLPTRRFPQPGRQIKERYGAASLPETPRIYAAKAKGAQEAHEAIRPAGDHFRTTTGGNQLRGREFQLYELIWKHRSPLPDGRCHGVDCLGAPCCRHPGSWSQPKPRWRRRERSSRSADSCGLLRRGPGHACYE